MNFQGILTSIAKNLNIFVIFQGGGPDPLPPSPKDPLVLQHYWGMGLNCGLYLHHLPSSMIVSRECSSGTVFLANAISTKIAWTGSHVYLINNAAFSHKIDFGV